jgi:hypothetical protein
MALSDRTIQKLADVLTPEVIDYIYNDERWVEFLQEVIPDAITEKIGQVDGDILFDLSLCIMDRTTLKPANL